MSKNLLIRNRQRLVQLNTHQLHAIATAVLEEFLKTPDFDLAVYIVRAPEMARLNEAFLQHEGSTDVITFDYSEPETSSPAAAKHSLHGEIFICIDDTLSQARQFGTKWPGELVRYVIHGFLHLKGFDDTTPAARRKMKQVENRLVKKVSRLFALSKIAGGSRLRA
ncbi:MAG TPA: rRNA maturation RNase YbeY [Verrucomicrobiae bacterium]|nr:rRNA maturation RNase YbeY [Verrucomicrobiae bacterium]